MRYYNKQIEVEKIFLENGFTHDDFVVGTGNTFSKKGKKFRFEFNARNRETVLKHTAKYAVKYFSETDFYILWKVRCKTSPTKYSLRSIYSIDYDEAIEAYNTNKNASKGVEFEWRFKEDVAVVDFETLKKIISNISNEGEE